MKVICRCGASREERPSALADALHVIRRPRFASPSKSLDARGYRAELAADGAGNAVAVWVTGAGIQYALHVAV
jgi:hypothetical protein